MNARIPVSPRRDPSLQARDPIVMHVFGALTIGGIETWLLHVLRNSSNSRVRHELLLFKDDVGPYEAEVRGMGIPIHRLVFRRNPFRWFVEAFKFFRRRGRISVVHSHGPVHFAPIVLGAAKLAGVPSRIAHSHEAGHIRSDRRNFRHWLRRTLGVAATRLVATRRLGISEPAIEHIAGRNWRRDPHSSVLFYGFDYSRNHGAPERARDLRGTLGIGMSSTVIGHVGRFDAVKNHAFLARSFAEFLKSAPDSVLVMVGAGTTRGEVEALCRDLQISDRVRFPGTTDDVPAYMAMFDLFVLPSFSEGLGIVCLEAQAAGTRSIISTGVARDVVVIPQAVSVLPIESGPGGWAKEMQRLTEQEKPDREQWRQAIEASAFGIRRCVCDLDAIYEAEIGRPHVASRPAGS